MDNSKKSFNKFLILWIGELVSAIGSGLTAFGLGIYVYQLTGKASAMTLVTLIGFLPSILLGPVTGVLADRYDRRFLMIIGDTFSVTGLIFILVCMLSGEAQLWQIYVGTSISSIFASLLEPAYRATITDLLSKEDFTKASGLVQIAGSSRFLISPILAGALLMVSDIKLLLIIDICTFFVTVGTTLTVRKGLKKVQNNTAPSFLNEIKDGWNAIVKKEGFLYL